MMLLLDESVGLLDEALAYTRDQLAGVEAALLDHPTPCAGWTLRDLLCHMEDSLDAFTEAACGGVDVAVPAAARGDVMSLQRKACGLLTAWRGPAPGDVVVGGLDLQSPLLVGTAALEIAVHGWDVGRSTRRGRDLPQPLARRLLPVARRVVDATDRGVRFAPARTPPPGASHSERLLAFLGRG